MINRGEIFYAELDPVIGSEQGGTRPVVILQNNVGNRYSPTVIVAPITTRKDKKNKFPTHINLNCVDNVKSNSVILLEQIRVVDKKRLQGKIGKLNDEQIKEINKALDKALGIK